MGEKKKKPQKLKARLPRGFVDRSPADIRATDEMVASIRGVFELYGFDPVETPMLEYTDALGKFLPDSDRPNEGVFSLTDDDDQWMSLRYDLTAPLARHVAENFNDIQLPYRTYRAGWVFRNEKPGPGRFRQFMQFDADTVGAPGVQSDAEMCMMMADTMEALGISQGDYVIRVNNRKVLDGVMETIGIGGDAHAETRLTVLRAIDKLDKFGTEGVRLLLGEGRKDESGDFTKGAGLEAGSIDRVIAFVEAAGANGSETIANLQGVVGDDSTIGAEGVNELSQVASLVEAAGYDDGRVKIDPSVVRGLEYYTGPVYEADLLFAVTNEKGQTVQFGSVGGGGRYDGLVSRFMGQPVPATGFSIGVSRLVTALKNLGKLGQDAVNAPVVVCVMDRDTESMGHYQRFVGDLRRAGIRAEMFQGNPKNFGKQLQYADRRDSPIAIIQGSQERAEGTVQIKDLIEGKRLSGEIEDNAAWRAARPAQVSVKESDLVAEVEKLLAAQAEDRKAS
ncbi:MAG: histidine--tRNA ligase [Hyphomicrobiales bacterium]|nr:histidine--tRNA ligase [Hyphomicrobiales bacterium]MCP5000815.1 histidine--tRNA ligase [Hyphomicrobiales bacterium]